MVKVNISALQPWKIQPKPKAAPAQGMGDKTAPEQKPYKIPPKSKQKTPRYGAQVGPKAAPTKQGMPWSKNPTGTPGYMP